MDAVTGTAGNDTFNATATATFNALDSLNGGLGNDTLNVLDNTAAIATAGRTVTGIETAVLSSAAGVVADTSGWTGLANLTVTSTAAAGQTTTAATTTAVTVSNSSAQAVTIVGGGGAVSATTGAGAITIGNAANGAANINGITSATTSGGTTVAITDNSGALGVQGATLTTVSITNAADDQTITGNGVTSLSLNKLVGATTVGDTTITSAAGPRALTVTYNGVDVGGDGVATAGTLTLTDSTATTVNVKAATAASFDVTVAAAAATAVTIDSAVAFQMDALTAALATSVAISGAALTTITADTLAATAVITSSSTGGVTLTQELLAGQQYVGTNSSGTDTIAVGATTKAITTGAGNDSVTLSSATLGAGGSINAGDGSDTLTTTAAIAATASATAALGTTFSTAVSGFEKLVLTGGGTNTVNVAFLGNYTDISSAGDTLLTLGGVTSGSTLRLTATGTAQTVSSTTALSTGTADSLNLVLTGTTTAADVAFSTTGLTATDVETINITSNYTSSMTAANKAAAITGGFANGMIVLGNQVKTIVVGGEAGLNLTAASTALTSLDASANTVGPLGEFSWTSGATTGAVNVKGLASGINTIVLSAATVAGTYTGSADGDTVTIANALANVLNLGDGTNLVNGAASGNNVVTGGAGADTFTTATTGNNVVNFGNGANAFTATSGNNTYTGGTGVDTVSVGGGLNVVDVGVDTVVDAVTITARGANANTYTTITNIAVGDTINLAALTTVPRGDAALGAKITLADTAAFADYVAAATATIIADAGASAIKWFQLGGNTYIVVDDTLDTNTPDDTNSFENGIDSVVRLTGLIDLTRSTTATDVLTIVA